MAPGVLFGTEVHAREQLAAHPDSVQACDYLEIHYLVQSMPMRGAISSSEGRVNSDEGSEGNDIDKNRGVDSEPDTDSIVAPTRGISNEPVVRSLWDGIMSSAYSSQANLQEEVFNKSDMRQPWEKKLVEKSFRETKYFQHDQSSTTDSVMSPSGSQHLTPAARGLAQQISLYIPEPSAMQPLYT